MLEPVLVLFQLRRADVTCFITLHDEQWQCKHDMICVLVEVYVIYFPRGDEFMKTTCC